MEVMSENWRTGGGALEGRGAGLEPPTPPQGAGRPPAEVRILGECSPSLADRTPAGQTNFLPRTVKTGCRLNPVNWTPPPLPVAKQRHARKAWVACRGVGGRGGGGGGDNPHANYC